MNKAIPIIPAAEVRGVVDALENAAKTKISTIIARKAEIREKKEELEGLLFQHPQYSRLDSSVKDMQKEKTEYKKKLMTQPEIAECAMELREMKANVQEDQLSLFDYLLDFNAKTGATEIVDNIGQKHEIIIQAKIKI